METTTAKVICLGRNGECHFEGDGTIPLSGLARAMGCELKQCQYYTKIGTFEESGKTLGDEWREKYEELRAQLPDWKYIGIATLEPGPDEVGVKPHKRHRPKGTPRGSKSKRRDGDWQCGSCGRWWPVSREVCPRCNSTDSTPPTPSEPPCATCDGDGKPICGCEALGEYNLAHPESLGLPEMSGSDSEGVLDHPDSLGATINPADQEKIDRLFGDLDKSDPRD
jgi:hypothetical protein